MDCPHCHVPLLTDSCPKCKYDPTLPNGGPRHLQWLAENGESVPESEVGPEAVSPAGKKAAGLTVLTRGNLAENCAALAKKDLFLVSGVMITVSLWITIMVLSDITKKGVIPPGAVIIWAMSLGVILYTFLSRRKTCTLIREKVSLGQFRLLRTSVSYVGKGKREYELNGESKSLPGSTIGASYVGSSDDCFLLMIGDKPEAILPAKLYALDGDLQSRLASASSFTAE